MQSFLSTGPLNPQLATNTLAAELFKMRDSLLTLSLVKPKHNAVVTLKNRERRHTLPY